MDTPQVLDRMRPELERALPRRRATVGPLDQLHYALRRQAPTVHARPIETSPMHQPCPVREAPERRLRVQHGPVGPCLVVWNGTGYWWDTGTLAGRYLGSAPDVAADGIARHLGAQITPAEGRACMCPLEPPCAD